MTTDLDRATGFMGERSGLQDCRGHWLEICQLQREDIEFFSALVAESA